MNVADAVKGQAVRCRVLHRGIVGYIFWGSAIVKIEVDGSHLAVVASGVSRTATGNHRDGSCVGSRLDDSVDEALEDSANLRSGHRGDPHRLSQSCQNYLLAAPVESGATNNAVGAPIDEVERSSWHVDLKPKG